MILLYETGLTVGLGGGSGLIILSQSDEYAYCDDNNHREKENWQGEVVKRVESTAIGSSLTDHI